MGSGGDGCRAIEAMVEDGLRKQARRSKEAQRKLRREIRETKKELWGNWVEEGREVWDIAQVCRTPFGLKERCETIKDNAGLAYETEREKLQAFTAHNLITDPADPRQPPGRQKETTSCRVDSGTLWRVMQALK